jgi:hypothetical protein
LSFGNANVIHVKMKKVDTLSYNIKINSCKKKTLLYLSMALNVIIITDTNDCGKNLYAIDRECGNIKWITTA